MKTAIFTLLLALLTQTSSALADSQLSCGNSKIFVKVAEIEALRGTVARTVVQISYVDFNNVLQGTFSAEDPFFEPDAQGFRMIYLISPDQDGESFFGKVRIDKDKESIALNGKLLAYGSQPLSVHGTYSCYE